MSESKAFQYHTFKVFTAAENTDAINERSVYMNVNVPFVAKKVKINFAYVIDADGPINIIVSVPSFNNDIVGSLSNPAYYDSDAGKYWHADGFKANNQFIIIFDTPKQISNSLELRFQRLTSYSITDTKIVAHMEFWS